MRIKVCDQCKKEEQFIEYQMTDIDKIGWYNIPLIVKRGGIAAPKKIEKFDFCSTTCLKKFLNSIIIID
jgi:hypothetical protein